MFVVAYKIFRRKKTSLNGHKRHSLQILPSSFISFFAVTAKYRLIQDKKPPLQGKILPLQDKIPTFRDKKLILQDKILALQDKKSLLHDKKLPLHDN